MSSSDIIHGGAQESEDGTNALQVCMLLTQNVSLFSLDLVPELEIIF